MKLSIDQLTDLARRHGFPDPAFAAAVAMAESTGETTRVADTRGRTDLPPGTQPEYSIGLWQINTLSSPGSSYTPAQLQDPDTNAQVAYQISNSGAQWIPGWTTTIKNATWKPFYHPGLDVVPPTPTPTNRIGAFVITTAALALVVAAGYGAYKAFALRPEPEPEPEPFYPPYRPVPYR